MKEVPPCNQLEEKLLRLKLEESSNTCIEK